MNYTNTTANGSYVSTGTTTATWSCQNPYKMPISEESIWAGKAFRSPTWATQQGPAGTPNWETLLQSGARGVCEIDIEWQSHDNDPDNDTARVGVFTVTRKRFRGLAAQS